jgi:LysM repeat protein
MNFYKVLLVLTSLLCLTHTMTAQQSKVKVPSPSVEIATYPWLHPGLNMVQFYSRSAMETFHKAWGKAKNERFSVVLLGDSHLQAGPYPEQLSRRLRKELGDAGHGLIFPNSTVKMYSPMLYRSKHTGTWKGQRSVTMRPKMDMGVRGFTSSVNTLPASFSFTFTKAVSASYTKVRIFCKNTPNSYDLIIHTGGESVSVPITGEEDLPYVEATIPSIKGRKLRFEVVKKNPQEKEFELYGVILETADQKGAIVHNAGVGAARYNSVLYQRKFSEELPHYEPDLVVIDFGTNDYLYNDILRPELESEIRKVITKVRKATPQASIILTTVQDLYRKGKSRKAAVPFANMIHRIAKEMDCGLWDWFWISGGQKTLIDWRTANLARKDMVHLTIKGYHLKGDLFFDAMKNTKLWMDQNTGRQLLLPMDKFKKPKTTTNQKVNSRERKVHTIRSGESLSLIATKYNVSVGDIVRWNKLENPDRIKAGQHLIIQF